MSPLGNEDARAQVGTNSGLSQRWRSKVERQNGSYAIAVDACASELDAAKLRIEEAVKALRHETLYEFWPDHELISREAVLKIIREIL